MPWTWSHTGVRGRWANLQCWRNTFFPCFQLTLLPQVEFDGSAGAWYLWDATVSALKGQEPSNCYSQAEWLPHRKSRGNSTGLLGEIRWGNWGYCAWKTMENIANTHLLLTFVSLVLLLHSCPILCDPHRLQLARLLCPWESPGKNTGVGCSSRGSSQPRNWTRVSCIGRWILYH